MNANMTMATQRLVSQVVAVGAASVASTALPVGTTAVRLSATVACFVEIGNVAVTLAAPTAVVNTSMYLPAGTTEYFQAAAGQFVAVIQAAAAGSLYVTPLD